jgi:hypothetical protein
LPFHRLHFPFQKQPCAEDSRGEFLKFEFLYYLCKGIFHLLDFIHLNKD